MSVVRTVLVLAVAVGCSTTPLPTPRPASTVSTVTPSPASSLVPTGLRIEWLMIPAEEPALADGSVTDLLVTRAGVLAAGDAFLDESSEGRMWISPDGNQWRAADLDSRGDIVNVGAVAALGEFLVAVGTGCCPQSATAWVSVDGQSWQWVDQASFAGGSMWALAATPQGVLGLGCSPADECEQTALWRSTDGQSWEQLQTTGLRDADLDALVWSGARMIGVGTQDLYANGPVVIATSTDGMAWQAAVQPIQQGYLSGVVVNPNGGLLAVGSRSDTIDEGGAGVLLTSADGTQWQSVESPVFANASFADVAVSGNTIVIVGTAYGANDDYPGAWLSLDGGQTWQVSFPSQTADLSGQITSIDVLPDGRFVAGGDQLQDDVSQPTIWIGTLVQ